MKVLWVVSRPLCGSFGSTNKNFSGSSLDAAFESCKNYDDLELHIVCVGAVSKILIEYRGRHVLYMLPGGGKRYDENDSINIHAWAELKQITNPNIIQICGTECDYAKLALKTFAGIPSIVYIHGVMDSVARGYDAELSLKTKLKILTPFDIIHRNWINAGQNRYYKRALREIEILNMVSAAIVESDWCEDQIRGIAPRCVCYRSNLPIKQVFGERTWRFEEIEPYTIFTNAGSMPLKGHHILFEALGVVKKSFPDVKLYVPGVPLNLKTNGRNFCTSGYSYLLASLIKKNNLQDNVCYVGLLSDVQMADFLSKVHLYVMPSCVENHSTSLIEAQFVGTPCVSSFVGGVSSIVKDGINALIYNYHDSFSLAGHIRRIFESEELARGLSIGAKEYSLSRKCNIGEDLINIYNAIKI